MSPILCACMLGGAASRLPRRWPLSMQTTNRICRHSLSAFPSGPANPCPVPNQPRCSDQMELVFQDFDLVPLLVQVRQHGQHVFLAACY